MQMSSKKNVIAIAITTVALTVGSIGVGQAASKTKVVSTKVTRTSSNGIANPMAKTAGPEEAVNSVLSALVTKGTITQAQADAIKAAFAAAAPVRGMDGPGKGIGPNDADRVALEALVSKTIGVDSATIRTRLAAGESLGAIAGAKKAELISVLVADETKRIDADVTAGKLTAAQATTLKAGLTAHITAEIDQVGGKRGPAMGGPDRGGKGEKGGRGHGGPGMGGMGAAPKIPAPTATPSA
jgi:polyhydroxyalkanoate synthesis regulator phasin